MSKSVRFDDDKKEQIPYHNLNLYYQGDLVVNLKRIERIENKRGRDRAFLNINQTKELSAQISLIEEIDTYIFLLRGQCSSPTFIKH